MLATILVTYYLGGVTTLLLDEYEAGGDISLSTILGPAAWPIGTVALIAQKIKDYTKGSQ
jgi:hypothetical protein